MPESDFGDLWSGIADFALLAPKVAAFGFLAVAINAVVRA